METDRLQVLGFVKAGSSMDFALISVFSFLEVSLCLRESVAV